MEDHEILTKRLSDWKPETDVKLQKVLGKFVEEAGELIEETAVFYGNHTNPTHRLKIENELADVMAFTYTIDKLIMDKALAMRFPLASGPGFILPDNPAKEDYLRQLTYSVGRMLTITGRSQIQGVMGRDPETRELNARALLAACLSVSYSIGQFITVYELDNCRISARRSAKVDSKMPWIMGTATDLLPDV